MDSAPLACPNLFFSQEHASERYNSAQSTTSQDALSATKITIFSTIFAKPIPMDVFPTILHQQDVSAVLAITNSTKILGSVPSKEIIVSAIINKIYVLTVLLDSTFPMESVSHTRLTVLQSIFLEIAFLVLLDLFLELEIVNPHREEIEIASGLTTPIRFAWSASKGTNSAKPPDSVSDLTQVATSSATQDSV